MMTNTDQAERSIRTGRRFPFLFTLVCLLLNAVATLTAAPGDTRWVFETGGAVNSSPAIGAGGTVYVGSADGKVYALEGRTGDKRWDFLTGGAVDSDPAIGIDGTVYVGSADGRLYALDCFTGSKKWATDIPKPYNSNGVHSPAIGADGTLYLAGSNGLFRALAGVDGSLKWEAPSASAVVTSAAIGADGTLYIVRGDWSNPIGSWINTQLCALDGATGSQKWAVPLNLGPPLTPAMGADGTVYAGSSITLYALDGATGNKRWESQIGDSSTVLTSSSGSPVIGVDGTIYVSGGYAQLDRLDGYVYALDGATGNHKWARQIGLPSRASAALGADGTVFLGTGGGDFQALDGATGISQWGIRADVGSACPAIGVEGTVYVGAADGKVYALEGRAGLARSSWPRFHGDARNSGSRQHLGPPTLMTPPTNQLVGVSFPFALEAVAEGAQPLSYTWFFNGAPLLGMTNSVLAFASFSETNAGTYRVRVANALGSVESPDLILTAGAQIAVEIIGPGKVQRTPAESLLPLGTAVELTALIDAGRPFLGWSGDWVDTNRVLRWTADRSLRLRVAFGYFPGQLKWAFQPPGDRASAFATTENGSPAMGADGTLYVCSETVRFRRVYALDSKTGVKNWIARPLGQWFTSSMVGVGGRVYVNSLVGGISALDGLTGNIQWTFPDNVSSAMGSDGTVYVSTWGDSPTSPGKIWALDGASGSNKWEFVALTGILTIGADGILYVGAFDGNLYALNPAQGTTNWVFRAGGYGVGPAIGTDGTLFFGSGRQKLYAVNAKDGRKKWECLLDAAARSSPVLGTDGTVYVGTDGSHLYALDGSTGNTKWVFPAGNSLYTSPAVGADGTVYVSCQDSKLYAVEGRTGRKKWEFQTGDSPASAPTIGADGTVYVTQKGAVYAVQGEGGLAQSSWPKSQGNVQNTGSVPPLEPAPAGPRLLNVERDASGVILIRWETTPGTRYQLQSTERLEAPAWANAGDVLTAAGQTASQSEAIAASAQRYYRVLRLEN